MATKLDLGKILQRDEHLREMENLRIELRDKMTEEYWHGFAVGAILGFALSLILGAVVIFNIL